MLSANKVAKKNLIQNFLSADWFNDYSQGGGTMSVDPVNPHKMTVTLDKGAQGKLIWIPVEIGKTYTFSFKSMTGLYRFYKRKVGNHDVNMVMVQDSNVGKPDTFSFTPDDTYKGFVTLRLTHSQAGTFTFENMQLEEGTKTPFEPYTLVNPKASVPPAATKQPKKNLIKPLTDSGWSKHANAVFVSDYYLKINQTSSFQTSGIDVALQAGNSYTLTVDDISPNGRMYVRQTLGGAFTYYIVTASTKSLSFNAVAGASYRVEFHANTSLNVEEYVKNFQLSLGNIAPFEPYQAVHPLATLYPKKNVYDKINNAFEVGSIASATGLDSPLNYVMRAKGYIAVKPNTTYCFTKPTNYYQISPYPFDRTKGYLGNGLRPSITVDGIRCKFTTPSNCFFIRWQFNSSDTNYVMTQSELNLMSQTFQIEEGSYPTDYEGYQLTNLRSE